MSLGVRKLLFRVVVRARVASVLPYRAMRPWLDAREPSKAGIVAHEIDGQLAPYDQLFEKRIAIASRCRRTSNRKRNGMRSDLAEVEIRRESAGPIDFGLVAMVGVVAQTVANKSTQGGQGCICAAAKHGGATHGPIDV